MSSRLLAPSDYRTMPWKNGHGTTHEIAVLREPSDEAAGSFVWRLSLAEVSVAAPFSRFPGCDRTIVLLAGDGMQLDSGVHGRHLLDRPFVPYFFRGEWQTDCQLVGGPCRDFNLMVDRQRAAATVSLPPLGHTPQRLDGKQGTLALFGLRGVVEVSVASERALLPAGHTWLRSEEASAPSVTVAALGDEAALLLVVTLQRIAG